MTTTAIATVESERIAKLLRLIFCSDKDGEVFAALNAAKRALAAAGQDGHYIVELFERGAERPVDRADHDRDGGDRIDDDDDDQNTRSAVWFCWHRRHRLSEKERAFIENVAARSSPLTPRQCKWVRDITDRLEAA